MLVTPSRPSPSHADGGRPLQPVLLTVDGAPVEPIPLPDIKTCDTCGQTATTGSVQLEELPPVNGFEAWRPKGRNYGCAAHPAKSQKHYMDGRVE